MEESSQPQKPISSLADLFALCNYDAEKDSITQDSFQRALKVYFKKKELAEKVLSGKRLNLDEKQDIYLLLTGKQSLPPKRGRPSETERDFKIAIDYLTAKANGKRNIARLRNEIAKKNKLPVDSEGIVRENTFYIALNRGINDLQDLATWWLERYYKGEVTDRSEVEMVKTASMFKDTLRMINSHKKQGDKLQKKVRE